MSSLQWRLILFSVFFSNFLLSDDISFFDLFYIADGFCRQPGDQVYESGESWFDPEDPCVECTCFVSHSTSVLFLCIKNAFLL